MMERATSMRWCFRIQKSNQGCHLARDYTWSPCIDDGSVWTSLQTASGAAAVGIAEMRLDRRQNINMSACTRHLSFPAKPAHSGNGLAGFGNVRILSGQYLTIASGLDNARVDELNQARGEPTKAESGFAFALCGHQEYSALAQPAGFCSTGVRNVWDSGSRNILGPGSINIDMA